jgi:hypothetical protein
MVAVTTHITTDVAAAPFLWVLPLSLYLLSFVVVFSRGRRRVLAHRAALLALPPAAIVLAGTIVLVPERPLWLIAGIHLAAFFVVALACHGELADDRPAPGRLTEFYFWVAAGGALGGLFNALVAPVVFSSVVEYPLVLVLACLLRPAPAAPANGPRRAVARSAAGSRTPRSERRLASIQPPRSMASGAGSAAEASRPV